MNSAILRRPSLYKNNLGSLVSAVSAQLDHSNSWTRKPLLQMLTTPQVAFTRAMHIQSIPMCMSSLL